MRLRREAGRILDGDKPIILAGGHYYLFQKDEQVAYRLQLTNNEEPGRPSIPVIWYAAGSEPCQKEADPREAFISNWPSPGRTVQGDGGTA